MQSTLFWERVRAFEADLIFGDVEDAAEIVSDYEQNDIAYKLFIKRLTAADGNTKYLFAMTSLQPVSEAVGVMRHYYGYVIVGSVLLAVLATFYYVRRIARPLLRLNEVTQPSMRIKSMPICSYRFTGTRTPIRTYPKRKPSTITPTPDGSPRLCRAT